MEKRFWKKEADRLWREAEKHWIGRKQDKNYRDFLVREHLLEALINEPARHLNFHRPELYVDIGCGDGSETQYLHAYLGQPDTYGFDINETLIGNANDDKIIFEAGNSRNLIRKHKLRGKADLVTTLFVLHDTPDYLEVVGAASDTLRKGGTYINVMVHPQFSKLMLKKHKEIISRDEDTTFCMYPIVEEDRTFYLPHFHRSLGTYLDNIEKQGFYLQKIIGMQPLPHDLKEAIKWHRSPFYEHETNVYWPEISQVPSSVLMQYIKA